MKTAFLSALALSATILVSQNAKTQDTKIAPAKVQDATIEEVGKSPVQAKFAPGGRIRMDLCSGGI